MSASQTPNTWKRGGARPGAGRKPDEWNQRFRRAVDQAVTEDDLREILNALVARAKAGDCKAAVITLQYVVGMPTQKLEHFTPDGLQHDHVVLMTAEEVERVGRCIALRDKCGPSDG